MATFNQVPEKPSFPDEEEQICSFWKNNKIFEKSIEISKDFPSFSFYDGPPFATGLPHYGHILAGTMKDIVVRYAFQTGHSVERRFGWDCHGLPVEYEIDKLLGIKSRQEVLDMGIAEYNQQCRKIVMRYSQEWRATVERLGRWIDFDNDYKTMNLTFMESCWWACKELFEKKLIYKSFKVMPYSTACSTPLSNFEVNLNYKDVSDPSITISFPLVEDSSIELLAWTTTPWTLISNLALAVNPEFDYVTLHYPKKDKKWVVAECRLEWICNELKLKIGEDLFEINRCKGFELAEKKYIPLFNYFYDSKHNYKNTSFRVLAAPFVTNDTGTGIVHCAPAFGEDDFNICLEKGVWEGSPLPCPIDENGLFTNEVPNLCGQNFKESDKAVRNEVNKMGRMIKSGDIVHSYPFCWRSDTPLMYRAVPCWFISVQKIKKTLIETTSETQWVPPFVKLKRFQNWVEDSPDWCFSRNRFWGTPIPIWMSQDKTQIRCIGSIEELEQYSNRKLNDIHREFIDDITIPDPRGVDYPPMQRIDEVFDCWFESGSMPYARLHYPFENQDQFWSSFPADFIGEGIDQTRGWFYTLMVLSSALFSKPAFKNLIATGLVLAEDGKKMSKRLKNYPNPEDITNKFGADALRIYLINSPVVRAETLRFKESGVKDVVRDIILPWFHAYRFFIQEATRFETTTSTTFTNISLQPHTLNNTMDKWIISYLQQLTKYFHTEMSAYRLYTIVPKLFLFLDQLTNWYVRLNRDRMKGKLSNEDAYTSLTTLFIVLLNITRLMTPYCPFICEYFYKNLKNALDKNSALHQESIGFVLMPQCDQTLIDQDAENLINNLQKVINLGRLIRERKKTPRKTPLKSMTILHVDPFVTSKLSTMQSYIMEELNVQEIHYCNDMSNIKLSATLNFKSLGWRLGKNMKSVKSSLESLSQEELSRFESEKQITIDGFFLTEDDLILKRVASEQTNENIVVDSDDTFSLILDFTKETELTDQARVREVVNRIQKLRKQLSFSPLDDIAIWLTYNNTSLTTLFDKHFDFFSSTLRRPINWNSTIENSLNVLASSEFIFEDTDIQITFTGHRHEEIKGNELNSSFNKLSIHNTQPVKFSSDFTSETS